MHNPLQQLIAWINSERQQGAPNPQQAVLATVSADFVPHARVVAIREIDDEGLLFFTQKGTRKVQELNANPQACITFWFELFQRQVVIEGRAQPLSQAENEGYWYSYSREAQIRFHSYAATSAQPIASKNELEEKRKAIARQYENQPIPMNDFYCGFKM